MIATSIKNRRVTLILEDSFSDRWERIQENIHEACSRSMRGPSLVRVIGVSKKKSFNDIIKVAEVGCSIFGENYIQEALDKIHLMREQAYNLEFHFIGSLQRNKVGKAISLFSMIHSVDSLKLGTEINKACAAATQKKMEILLQVNVSEEAQKGGVRPMDIDELYGKLASLQFLSIKGLMTIGSIEANESTRRKEFQKLRNIRDTLEKTCSCKLPVLSMGMSDDYQIAIEEGATLVRIGSALFGERI